MTVGALSRGARGAGIVMLGQAGRVVLQFVGVLVLSRLLTPKDFGLVAMVAVFIALGDLLRDFGVPTAALQARELTHQQSSNLFWVNSVLGATAAVALAAAAPAIAAFYNEPRLTAVAPAMAIGLLLNGVQAQVQVQLARDMKFGTLAATDIGAQAAGLAVAIGGAASGWGYWALVAQPLTIAVTVLTSRFLLSRWRPSMPRRKRGSARLLRASGEFGLAQLLTFVSNNVDTMVIGARWGASELGYYSRAFQLFVLPRAVMLDALTQVVVPTVNAAVARGERRASDLLLRVQFVLSVLLGWVYLIAALLAEWLVPVVLGDQWGRSIRVFQILCIGGLFSTFGTVSYWTFIVAHKGRQLLYMNLVTRPLAIMLVVLGSFFGIEAVAWSYAAGLALAWPISLIWLHRCAAQNSWSSLWSGARVVVAACVAYLVAGCVRGLVGSLAPLVVCLVLAGVGSLVFFAALAAMPGGLREMREGWTDSKLIIGRGPN